MDRRLRERHADDHERRFCRAAESRQQRIGFHQSAGRYRRRHCRTETEAALQSLRAERGERPEQRQRVDSENFWLGALNATARWFGTNLSLDSRSNDQQRAREIAGACFVISSYNRTGAVKCGLGKSEPDVRALSPSRRYLGLSPIGAGRYRSSSKRDFRLVSPSVSSCSKWNAPCINLPAGFPCR